MRAASTHSRDHESEGLLACGTKNNHIRSRLRRIGGLSVRDLLHCFDLIGAIYLTIYTHPYLVDAVSRWGHTLEFPTTY